MFFFLPALSVQKHLVLDKISSLCTPDIKKNHLDNNYSIAVFVVSYLSIRYIKKIITYYVNGVM